MAIVVKGTWWRESNIGAALSTYRAAVIGPNRAIVVGVESGTPAIATANTADLVLSPTVWTSRTPAGTDQLYGVDYAADIDEAVAVGVNAVIETSINQGLNWTGQNLAGAADLFDVVAASGAASRFVAGGFGVIWGRTSGGAWSTRWTGSQQWYGVAYRPGTGWAAVGLSGFVTASPSAANGSFITPYVIGGGVFLASVRANDSIFLAVGSNGAVYRSANPISGSWADVSLGESVALVAVAPLAPDNTWAIADATGRLWLSADNGSTWTEISTVVAYPLAGLANSAVSALATGGNGSVYVTYDDDQPDYVPADTKGPGVVGPAFSANDDMAGDAVSRLITQFRSGRG